MLFGKKKAIFVSMNKEEMLSLQNALIKSKIPTELKQYESKFWYINVLKRNYQNALNIGCDCIKENGMTDVGFFAADNNDLITQSGNIIPQTSIEEIER